jgi:hypothetical protein
MVLKSCETAFDFFVAGDKRQGSAKSLGRRVCRSLRSEADEVVEGADFMLDGHEVPRQYIGMQGVVQPDLVDGYAQDHELLTPFLEDGRSISRGRSDLRY